ncbi:lipid A deacylase LpxR family protein [Permianibacter aggregans]|uniref:Lipid A deacylase LpxR family protein n=1 Tax=Permianibacter aggregans TaxID=1510150 RepID=A0A4R6UMG2_9GAMM|nr:lipid A deacylase LpxR family protein [Permianibacter aggregans]QGX40902.1 lipid A deacylase LpxR family protein [Permianibacter aggregans]TDQ48278.1 hypothetical protein EV696_10714 [Permianibacter aggregans]
MNKLLRNSLATALVLLSPVTLAADPEPAETGWAFYIDNDLLTPGHRDRDYTGGFSLTRSGRDVADGFASLEPVRASIDRLFGVQGLYQDNGLTRHSQEVGITTFTPADLDDLNAQQGDRPYASLLYFSQSTAHIDPHREVAYLSTLTVGLLGLELIGELQTDLHKAFGATEPQGWDNQISNGGEPTFRYSVARTARNWSGSFAGFEGESTTALRASAGYLTQLTFGMATRVGEIHSPWWSYNPQLADYAEKTVPVAAAEGGAEQYFWAGFSVHWRLYNAFLQGQFRDSAVTFSANELEPLVAEAWLGYTLASENGWRFSYVLRAMSSEIKNGPGDRSLIWGGLTISQAF